MVASPARVGEGSGTAGGAVGYGGRGVGGSGRGPWGFDGNAGRRGIGLAGGRQKAVGFVGAMAIGRIGRL